MTMDILSQAGLMGVDPDARGALGKTSRNYFEVRCEESVPDAVKDAFTMLLDTTTARRELQNNDGPSDEVFYDAVEEVGNTRRTPNAFPMP